VMVVWSKASLAQLRKSGLLRAVALP
jgi:hypothetical protein